MTLGKTSRTPIFLTLTLTCLLGNPAFAVRPPEPTIEEQRIAQEIVSGEQTETAETSGKSDSYTLSLAQCSAENLQEPSESFSIRIRDEDVPAQQEQIDLLTQHLMSMNASNPDDWKYELSDAQYAARLTIEATTPICSVSTGGSRRECLRIADYPELMKKFTGDVHINFLGFFKRKDTGGGKIQSDPRVLKAAEIARRNSFAKSKSQCLKKWRKAGETAQLFPKNTNLTGEAKTSLPILKKFGFVNLLEQPYRSKYLAKFEGPKDAPIGSAIIYGTKLSDNPYLKATSVAKVQRNIAAAKPRKRNGKKRGASTAGHIEYVSENPKVPGQKLFVSDYASTNPRIPENALENNVRGNGHRIIIGVMVKPLVGSELYNFAVSRGDINPQQNVAAVQ